MNYGHKDMKFHQLFNPTPTKQAVTFITLVVLLVVAYFGMIQLRITVDSKAFFSDASRVFSDLQKISRKYGEINNIGILVMPEDGNVFSQRVLSVVEQFTREADSVEYSVGGTSLISYSYVYDQEGELIISPLLEDFSDKD